MFNTGQISTGKTCEWVDREPKNPSRRAETPKCQPVRVFNIKESPLSDLNNILNSKSCPSSGQKIGFCWGYSQGYFLAGCCDFLEASPAIIVPKSNKFNYLFPLPLGFKIS